MSEQDELLLTNEEINDALERMVKKYPAIKVFYDVIRQKPDGGESLIRETIAEAQLAKVKQPYEQLIENTLRDFSDIQREEGHPKSYWAGYHYARGLVMSALEMSEQKRLGRVCPRCKGSGQIEVGVLRGGVFRGKNITCPDCNGTGRLDRPALRKEIADIIIADACRQELCPYSFSEDMLDQILALIPDEEEIRKQQQVEGTKYYAEMMKKATDRVSKEAKKQEGERIIRIVNTPSGQVGNKVSTNSVALFRKFILSRIGKP